MIRLLISCLVAMFITVEVCLAFYLWEYCVWVVPLELFLNFLFMGLFMNQVLIRLIVFPYSVTLVKH